MIPRAYCPECRVVEDIVFMVQDRRHLQVREAVVAHATLACGKSKEVVTTERIVKEFEEAGL
jgi:hypothetical protein